MNPGCKQTHTPVEIPDGPYALPNAASNARPVRLATPVAAA